MTVPAGTPCIQIPIFLPIFLQSIDPRVQGTQCARIVENFGHVHLSAGDLLREERAKPGSEVSPWETRVHSQ